jgi:hypothetical protein
MKNKTPEQIENMLARRLRNWNNTRDKIDKVYIQDGFHAYWGAENLHTTKQPCFLKCGQKAECWLFVNGVYEYQGKHRINECPYRDYKEEKK